MNKLSVALREHAATRPDNVSDLIVSYLRQLGVDYVFGIPGGAVEPLYDALARSARNGGPRHVLARHEAGAAFMADGYARETGKIGVCLATSGPGATNLITGVACAYDNNVPMLVITGQPPLPAIGKRAFQESTCTGINIPGMFSHCTRYNSLVSHPDQAEMKLVNAFARAWQAPQGPAHLSIPVDVLRSPVITGSANYDLQSLLMGERTMIDEMAVRSLYREIKQSRNIVLLIGGGCSNAIESVVELAHLTGALFVTTPDAKGLVNPADPSYRGVFGFAGHESAETLLKNEPDLIIALGATLGEWTSGGWNKNLLNDRLVHIDSCEENLMQTPMARLHVRGHIDAVCTLLNDLLRARRRSMDKDDARKYIPPRPTLHETANYNCDATPIKPQRLMRELSLRCPPNTRVVADTGNSTSWAVHYLEISDRRLGRQRKLNLLARTKDRRRNHGWLRVTMNFAPMGWAIGAAVGIARANPECPAMCITGDGSYLMNGQEISVAAEEQLSVVFIILNDAALGMVKHGQRLAGAEPTAYQLPRVNFAQMAESMNVPGFIVHSPEDFDALDLETMLKRKGPTLIDVRIDGEAIPPMSVRMRALASATTPHDAS